MSADICLTDDTLEMAKQARRDQGMHEMDVTFGQEGDLLQSLQTCSKNPGHSNFIPIYQMASKSFPEGFQDECLTKFMAVKSQETVRLVCMSVSAHRPKDYAFSSYSSNKISMKRFGSGRAWMVHEDKIQTIPCPFENCTLVEGEHTVQGFLKVHTAKHVVFDDEEAKNTTVEFFYDSEDRSSVVTAQGFEVVKSDVEGDYCVINCVSHDENLCQRLIEIQREGMQLWAGGVRDLLYGKDISVVISHPHGRAKQLSMGGIEERNWGQVTDDQGWYTYVFSAATCPGSSGAPVWVPGKEGLFSGYAPHSGFDNDRKLSKSAVWFFWNRQIGK